MEGDGDDALPIQGTDPNAGAQGGQPEGQDPGEQGDELEGELSAEHADDEEAGGEQEVAGSERRPSRGEGRIQRLANEAKAAREEAAAARREAEELRRQQWQQQSARSEQEERERLALMTPDERAEYRITQAEQRFERSRREDAIRTQSTMDKVAYDAKASINPVYAKFKDEVEDRFQQQLAKNRPVDRETLLIHILGTRALQGAAAGGKGVQRQARQRVEQQRVPAGSPKGDAAATRSRQDTAEARLKDVFI